MTRSVQLERERQTRLENVELVTCRERRDADIRLGVVVIRNMDVVQHPLEVGIDVPVQTNCDVRPLSALDSYSRACVVQIHRAPACCNFPRSEARLRNDPVEL